MSDEDLVGIGRSFGSIQTLGLVIRTATTSPVGICVGYMEDDVAPSNIGEESQEKSGSSKERRMVDTFR
jgi:hypothetical protein